MEFIVKKPLSAVGMLFFILLLAFLGININQSAMNAINSAFDISFLTPEPLPETCASTSAVMDLYNVTSNRVDLSLLNFSESRANNALNNSYVVSDLSSAVHDSEGNNYFILVTYPEQATRSDLIADMGSDAFGTVQKLRFCSMSADYELCQCVGSQPADILIFKDYLLEQGLLEQAVMNILLNSLLG